MSFEKFVGQKSNTILSTNHMDPAEYARLEAELLAPPEILVPHINKNKSVVYGKRVFKTIREYNEEARKYNYRNRYRNNVRKMIMIQEVIQDRNKLYNKYNVFRSRSNLSGIYITDEYEWKTFEGEDYRAPTKEDLIKGIVRAYNRRNSDYSSIKLYFIDSAGNDVVRNLTGIVDADGNKIDLGYTKRMVREQIDRHITVGDDLRLTQDFIQGSDAYNDLDYLNPLKFAVTFRRVEVGNSIPKAKFNKHDSMISYKNNFKIVDFPNEDNNCLIEVFRRASKTKTTLTNKQIKEKILGVSFDSKLGIEHVPKLEDFFKSNVYIVVDSLNKKYINNKEESKTKPVRYSTKASNIKKFRTEVKVSDYPIYGECDTSDFWILFSDNHASLILDRQHKFFCRVSGEPVKKQNSMAKISVMKESLIESGRIQILEQNEIINNTDKEKYYWFYDYETIVRIVDGDFLEPYSVACVAGVIDPQTKLFVEEKRYTHLGTEGCTELFIDWLIQEADPDKDNLLIGYNSSRFDNLFFIEGLLKKNLINSNSLFLSGNSILGLKFDTFRCIDLCRILCTPLKTACEEMKMEVSKGVLSHSEVQHAYYNGKFEELLQQRGQEIIEYNIKDCTCLAALYVRTRKEINSMLGRFLYREDRDGNKTRKTLDDYMTVSSITYDAWTNICKEVTIPSDYQVWCHMRKAVYGGRSQIFRKGVHHGLFQSVDAKSLYPFVMIGFQYPIGKEIETEAYVEGKMGIYKCVIKSQPKVNIIPLRTKAEPLNWEYEGEIKTWLCTVDIDCIRRHGGEVEIGKGYYWEESSDKVFDILKVLKDFKTQQDNYNKQNSDLYNPAFRQLSKQFLNSLSGKVSQRIHSSSTSIITNMKDEAKFSSKHENIIIHPCFKSNSAILTGDKKDISYVKSAKTVHIGVFIYAYARTHMYDSLISKLGSNQYGTDTDAIHIDENKFNIANERGYGKFNLGGEFGDFEKEINFKAHTYYGVAPKCYGMFGDANEVVVEGKPEYCKKCEETEERRKKYLEDSERVYGYVGPYCYHNSKLRFKGVGKKDKILDMSKEDFMKLTTIEKTELYHKLKPALGDQTLYARLCAGEDANIVCSQLRKTINNNDTDMDTFNINQVFMFKTIKGINV